MYQRHFGMKQRPFAATPQLDSFFAAAGQEEREDARISARAKAPREPERGRLPVRMRLRARPRARHGAGGRRDARADDGPDRGRGERVLSARR